MGAGASSKGKSPGSTAPKIPTPPQIGQIGQSTQNLGQYESQFINEPWSLGNWAMNIATGGTGPEVTQNPLLGGEGTQSGFFGLPGTTSSAVQTYGPGGTGGSGGVRTGGGVNPFGGGPTGGVGGGGSAPGGPVAPGLPGILGGFSAGENAAWNTATSPYPGTAPSDFAAAQTGITNQESAITAQEAALQKDIGSFGRNWLTPQQNKMIDLQTQAAKEQVAQQEGSMGLAGSTQAAELAGEMGLAGVAAKGQLQQGNMQLVQGWQKLLQGEQGLYAGEQGLGQGEQGLALGAQQQAFNQFLSIAQLSSAEQAQMFQEGTAGYQLMQTFMGAVLQPYGISLQAFNDILQANVAQVGDQVALQSTAISADQSAQNQVVSSLGQVLSSILQTK